MNTVLITGSDRGLGFALTEEMLNHGWKVYAGQYMPEWNELAGLKERWPAALVLLPLDVSSGESIENAVKQIRADAGRLDMLISNAGINAAGEGGLDGELNTERTRLCFRVNSLAPLRLTQACLPLMENGMKRLCYVSSEAGSIAVCTREGISGYCMSKTALNMGVRLLYNELRPKGYTFRLYHPGWLRTYMSGVKNTNGKLEAADSAKTAVRQFTEPRLYEDALEVLDWDDAAWPF